MTNSRTVFLSVLLADGSLFAGAVLGLPPGSLTTEPDGSMTLARTQVFPPGHGTILRARVEVADRDRTIATETPLVPEFIYTRDSLRMLAGPYGLVLDPCTVKKLKLLSEP